MESLIQDLRYAARTLLHQKAFTVIAVLTLAIGIGASTAIFSVVDATILRTLPYQEPERLMNVSLVTPLKARRGQSTSGDIVWSYPKYATFRDSQQVFESTALYTGTAVSLSGVGDPERLRVENVSASYFPTLGVRAAVGRTFLLEEDSVPARDFVAVISFGLWERRFGADPNIIGKTIGLDRRQHTVVGVLPPGFHGLSGPADVWTPVHVNSAEDLGQRWSHQWEQIARLKPGVSIAQAKAAVETLGPRIDAAHADRNFPGWGARTRELSELRVEPQIRKSVLVLFGAVIFVLLIACVNIANLLLARSGARRREIAVRQAIGATRARLVRQLLTESVLLSVLGAIASIALAWWGVYVLNMFNSMSASSFGRRLSGLTALGLSSIRLDSTALLFTFTAAIVTGILFGLAPALQSSRSDVTTALKSGKRVFSGKGLLVVTEIALAVVLLVGAGLMLKSFTRLIATRTGVDPESLLTVRINLPQGAPGAGMAFFSQLEQRVAALPGVTSAGLSNCHALSGGCNGTLIWFRDRPAAAAGTEPIVGVHFVSPDYFKTLRIPLIKGRFFSASDRQGAPKVVVISETAVRRFWPEEDPIGKPVGVGQGGFGDRAEVIGVVGDVRYGQMEEPPMPDVYISHLQSQRTNLLLSARTTGDPSSLYDAVRHEVRQLNKDVPVFDMKTMEDRIRDATARSRFSAVLLAVFASIAVILAAVGIYGVMSYLVAQRTREIGIRMALGAHSRDVLRLVVGRGALLAGAGIAIGLAGALAATRVLRTLLFEVKPEDPGTYVSIGILLAVIAMLACYIPARRAALVDPSSALRTE